jgi:hypothetical protein
MTSINHSVTILLERTTSLRRVSLTLLKADTSLKVGIKSKRSRAGWDQDYMAKLLASGVLSI